jgi:zinc dependent phospholipase C
MRLRLQVALALLVCLFGLSSSAYGYSLLTHEQLIDLTWDTSIVPLLLSRYPTLTPAELEHARAYAYGGCVIQDIGYYPFGDKNFSNLTHYVRSGDFVVNLFRNAGNADELAFAVGALSHYIGDSIGHSLATNVAVPVEFPKLKKRYGNVVNYAEGEEQHVRTEFAFDIDEIANHRFAPVAYLRHVGLEVPTRQLALAFYQTYGMRDDFTQTRHERVNVSDYRWAVHSFIPHIAYSTTLLHRRHEPADVASDPDVQRLIQEVTAIGQKNHWDDYRKHPGFLTYTLAGVLFILPKVGPIRFVSVKGPTSQTELEYVHSVIRSTDALNHALRRFTPPPATRPTAEQAAAADTNSLPPPSEPLPARPGAYKVISSDPHHPLLNRDLDTGNPVKPAGYPLTDQTYAYLLHHLTLTPAVPVPEGVRDDILAYYADLSLPFDTKKNPAAWDAVQRDLTTLQTMAVNSWPVPYPTYGDGTNDDVPPPTTTTPPPK